MRVFFFFLISCIYYNGVDEWKRYYSVKRAPDNDVALPMVKNILIRREPVSSVYVACVYKAHSKLKTKARAQFIILQTCSFVFVFILRNEASSIRWDGVNLEGKDREDVADDRSLHYFLFSSVPSYLDKILS